MGTRIITEKTERVEVLVRYKVGRGGRPMSMQGESPVVRERWVPISELVTRDGRQYWRCVIGHGDWEDIPIEV
jgi:hypothetical protein